MSKKKKKTKKRSHRSIDYKKYRLYQIVFSLFTMLGFIILGWCGFIKGNPFPYASYIGMFLIFIGMVVFMKTDKSPNPKVPPTSGDLGGGSGS